MAKSISPLQQLYFAWDLIHKKSVSDDTRFTGILSEAKVDLNPHQVEAALFAFKSPLSKGAILADEVGLGKTIEAGIILSEMWAEHKRNILIIVPASLRNQWNIELMEKFFLPSTILLSDNYSAYKSAGVNPLGAGEDIIVCSYNFAAKYSEDISKVSWDLVVIDEAHKLKRDLGKVIVIAFEHSFGLGDAQILDIGKRRGSRDAQEQLTEIHGGNTKQGGKLVIFDRSIVIF